MATRPEIKAVTSCALEQREAVLEGAEAECATTCRMQGVRRHRGL